MRWRIYYVHQKIIGSWSVSLLNAPEEKDEYAYWWVYLYCRLTPLATALMSSTVDVILVCNSVQTVPLLKFLLSCMQLQEMCMKRLWQAHISKFLLHVPLWKVQNTPYTFGFYTNNQLILTTHSFTVDVSTMWDRAERPQRNLDCSGWQSESFSHRVINRPTSTHHCLRFTSQHSHKKPSRTQKSHHFTGESGSIHHTGAANKVLVEKKTPTSAPLRRDLTDIRAAVTSHSHTFRCRVCSCAVLFHI